MRFGKESRGQVKARQNAPGAVAFGCCYNHYYKCAEKEGARQCVLEKRAGGR